MVIFALSIWVIGLPLSLLVRHKPEQYGYLPDGEVSSGVIQDKGQISAQTAVEDIGASQALMSSAFWHISLALMCQMLITAAVITHVMPYLSSISIARSTSSLVASAIPLISISGRLGSGWLGDRLDKRLVAAGGFATMSLGLLFFGYAAAIGEPWLFVPFLILFGVGYGGNITIRAALIREYFGRGKFGTIHGFMMGVLMVGGIVGPPLAGWVFDNYGSYQSIWFVFAGLSIVALLLMVTAPKPRHRPAK